MLSAKMEKAFNQQINAELYSSYLYYSMCAYFESINLSGFSQWMLMQTQEEMFHANKFFHYVNERGGRVLMEAIGQPKTEWNSAIDVFTDVLEHEQKVTGLINGLMDLAQEEKDHASQIFLQWFVAEQVEEEATVGGVLHKLELIDHDSAGLFALDQELGQRIFTPPVK